MPDFLTLALAPGPTIKWEEVGLRLLAALLLGRVVALVYTSTRPINERTPSFPTTLVLLSVLIAMVTQVIGDNVARAFSLVGALSIVRFRTVVRDTVDTAFVIFAVAVGMAAGASNASVALSGIGVVGIAAWFMTRRRMALGSPDAYLLQVKIGLGNDAEAVLGQALGGQVRNRRLVSMSTARQGLALEATYRIELVDDRSPGEVVKALNRVEGVQGVSLNREPIEDR